MNQTATPEQATDEPRAFSVSEPPGRFLVGHTLEYLQNPITYLSKVARTHGDFVRLKLAHTTTYLVTHPALIDEILRGQASSMVKDIVTRALAPLVGQGLLTSERDVWRRQRRLIQPAFGHEAVQRYGRVMVDLTERMLDTWKDGQTVDLQEEMSRLTLSIVGKTLFDAEVGGDADVVGNALEHVMDFFLGPGKWFPGLRWAPTPSGIRFRRAIRKIDQVIYKLIAERRREGVDRGDLLSKLIAATDDEGGMSDRQLRDECVTLFLAGHETTALALTYALALLSRHPECAARVESEVLSLAGARSLKVEDVPSLGYTECVVREAMRLYPPAWGIAREATEDLEIGGCPVKKGDQFFMVQWIVHRDPRWFGDPEDFRPDRWKDQLIRRLPRCAYFPFGDGPRICIGNHFAMMEAVLVLASIMRRYRVIAPPNVGPIEVVPSITLRPRDRLLVRLEQLDQPIRTPH